MNIWLYTYLQQVMLVTDDLAYNDLSRALPALNGMSQIAHGNPRGISPRRYHIGYNIQILLLWVTPHEPRD